MNTSSLQAYNDGIRACADGKSLQDNPYPNGSMLQSHWRTGFQQRKSKEDLTPEETNYTPIETAIALSLYAYNVSSAERAQKIYDHFQGDCMEIEELTDILIHRGAYLATELPFPSAQVYVNHALERYGEEARQRVEANGG